MNGPSPLPYRRARQFARFAAIIAIGVTGGENLFAQQNQSIARIWNEQVLDAIRNDTARPTVHARNLFHASVAIYDAWAAYDQTAAQVLHQERATAVDVERARQETISYAAHRVLLHRFLEGPGGTGPGRFATSLAIEEQMFELGYDPFFTSTEGNSPAALGNRIARTVIDSGLNDGANEAQNYADPFGYQASNVPLTFDLPGTTLADPNRWQPLHFLRERRDQFGNVILAKTQSFLSPYWGQVRPFALTAADRSNRGVYRDQGPCPLLGGIGDAEFRSAVNDVIRYSSWLDPNNADMIDISPATRGNSPLGTYVQRGHDVNPSTGLAYQPQLVRRSDWGRVVAEFWADGPESEAPPGHWNVIANDVSDKLDELGIPKRIGGQGPAVGHLEWDAKMYLALNGAVHDSAVVAWNHKGVYDYVRPISMIRYMGGLGQSTIPNLSVIVNGVPVNTYHPNGLTLEPGLVEVITPETTTPGGRHSHLAGKEGRIAVLAWQGQPDAPIDSPDDVGGVGWILAEEWLPYQRDDFVTPPFAAYISGHSTFSRAGAEVMTKFTGDSYFPGGLFEYDFPMGKGLEFEYGPSLDLSLQWATYYDAADEAGLSRLWGGIHVPADDLFGRVAGSQVGLASWDKSVTYYTGVVPEPASVLLTGIGGLIFAIRRVRRNVRP